MKRAIAIGLICCVSAFPKPHPKLHRIRRAIARDTKEAAEVAAVAAIGVLYLYTRGTGH